MDRFGCPLRRNYKTERNVQLLVIDLHTCIHTHIYTHTHSYIHAHTLIYTRTQTHTLFKIHRHTHRTATNTHTHTQTLMNLHTYTHSSTYKDTQGCNTPIQTKFPAFSLRHFAFNIFPVVFFWFFCFVFFLA